MIEGFAGETLVDFLEGKMKVFIFGICLDFLEEFERISYSLFPSA